MATPSKLTPILSMAADGDIILPQELTLTVQPAGRFGNGGILEDKGESFPHSDTGEVIRLGDMFWRAQGTIQFGTIKQIAGIHIPRADADGNRIRKPEAGEELALPDDTKYHSTSGSRWELYYGAAHPWDEFNINMDSYSARYASPTKSTAGASGSFTKSMWGKR